MEYEMEMESLHIGFGFESEAPSGTAGRHARVASIKRNDPLGGGGMSARNDARATFIGLSNALRAATK